MIRVDATSFTMGSTADVSFTPYLDPPSHQQHIDRSFAVSSTEVTARQYSRFLEDKEFYFALLGDSDTWAVNEWTAHDLSGPVNGVSWYMAAAYCNWLSKQEGLPPSQWCYQANAEEKFSDGMRAVPDYTNLSGFRLPSEAEWEYSCRGESLTRRHFGDSDKYLTKYVWCFLNAKTRTWPVGTLKPNDLGLFDTLGNVDEWCHTRIDRDYSKLSDDREDSDIVRNRDERVLRGKDFAAHPEHIGSWIRNYESPTRRNANYGFRVARTIR